MLGGGRCLQSVSDSCHPCSDDRGHCGHLAISVHRLFLTLLVASHIHCKNISLCLGLFCFNSVCMGVMYVWVPVEAKRKKKTHIMLLQDKCQPRGIKHKNKENWLWLLGTPNYSSPGIVIQIFKGHKALGSGGLSHSLCVRVLSQNLS